MSYTLYGKKGSGSASVEAALAIVGAPFRVVETAEWDRNADYDALLAINPIGQIPTLLLPDGSVLSESAAIHIHLAEAFPDAQWLPRDASARAQAIRGLVFIAANCYPMITIIDYPQRFVADLGDDEALQARVRSATRARLHMHWDVFAQLFPGRPFLSGAALGALDLYAAVVSRWSGGRPHIERSHPALHQVLQRIEADPRVAQVFARHWPAS